jgi:hypothetical protein
MLSIDLWRWYINITITILDIIHRPVFYLKKKNVLETGFCHRLHVEPTQVVPADKTSLCLVRQVVIFHLKTETESSFRNLFLK